MSFWNHTVVADDLTRCEEFYGFSARPFSLTPDLRFTYASRSHSQALEQVTEAFRRREGLVVITGEIGTGKTMLCRTLLETFREARTFLSVVLDPLLTVDDLLHQVLTDFGLITKTRNRGPMAEATRHQMVSTLQQFLASLVPLNAHAAIMIDEAQHLSPGVLEEIRLLSNFEADNAKLLQIVLVGQPNLETLLRKPEMRQLDQRVARRLQLHPLSDAEVSDYITRRLGVAAAEPSGETSDVRVQFTPAAIGAVRTISKGIPRVVNTICDRALELGCGRQLRVLDRDVVLAAADELKLPVPAGLKLANTSRLATAAAALVVVGALGVWTWISRTTPGAAPPSTAAAPPAPVPEPSQPPSPSSQPPPSANTAQPAAPPAATKAPAPSGTAPSSPTVPPAGASHPIAPARETPLSARGTDTSSYHITVAAFKTSRRAIDVATEVAAKGFPATTRADSTGQWYLVMVGPYASPDAAANAQRALAREGYADTRITPAVQPQ